MTRRLLDTPALLWALAGDERLPSPVLADLDREPAAFLVSDATFWEIAIKRSVGKLDVPDDLPQIVDELGLSTVGISQAQAWAVADLELHHRDPFDRMLIAQARDLGLPIVTADRAFAAYDVAVHWPRG